MPIKRLNPVFLVFIFNLTTLILKIIAYLTSVSSAVLSDMLNDLADTIGSSLLLLGVYFIKRGVRNRLYYPFGISRATYIFGLISVSVIGGVLFAIAFSQGMSTLVYRRDPIPSPISLKSVTISLIVNIVATSYTIAYYRAYRKTDPSVLGSFIDSFTDTLGNIIVIAALMIKSYLIDGIGSLLIAGVLLISSITIGYRYFLLLIGRSPPKEDLLRILNAILTTPGVYDVNELKSIMLTEDEYIVIAEVEIDHDMRVTMTEKVSQEIENRVRAAVPKVRFFAVEFVARRNEPATYRKLFELIRKER